MSELSELKEKIQIDIEIFQGIIKTVEKGHGENCPESMEYRAKIAYAKEILKAINVLALPFLIPHSLKNPSKDSF